MSYEHESLSDFDALLPHEKVVGGYWITTFTGKHPSLDNPHTDDIDIRDIAHSLSMQCHWVGHCREFISLAEHSIHVSHQFTDPEDALWGLLHDSPEAYLGDMSRPLKKLFPFYQELELAWMETIAKALNLRPDPPTDLKIHDNAVLHMEARVAMHPSTDWKFAFGERVAPGVKLYGMGFKPAISEYRFLERFKALEVQVSAETE